PRESVGIALGALRANKLRSFLTLLGTIIGVTAVIFVVSIVQGLNAYVTDKLLQAGSNVFYVDQFGFITSQEEWEARRHWPEVAEELFPGLDALGRTIRIGEDSFWIVGVTAAKGKLLGQTQDRFVTIPIRTFQKLRNARANITIAVKSVDQPSLQLAVGEAR